MKRLLLFCAMSSVMFCSGDHGVPYPGEASSREPVIGGMSLSSWKAALKDNDERNRRIAVTNLVSKAGDPHAKEMVLLLLEALRDTDFDVRRRAAEGIGTISEYLPFARG